MHCWAFPLAVRVLSTFVSFIVEIQKASCNLISHSPLLPDENVTFLRITFGFRDLQEPLEGDGAMVNNLSKFAKLAWSITKSKRPAADREAGVLRRREQIFTISIPPFIASSEAGRSMD